MIDLVKSPVNGYVCLQDPGEPVWGGKRLSISDVEGKILAELSIDKSVLEIGTGLGVSTTFIAGTARCVYTIDIDPWVKENVAPSLPKNVHFFKSVDEYGIMPGFDMAFVDGLHEYEQILKDISNVRRLVKTGGLLLFHDFRLPQVSRALVVSKINTTSIMTTAGIGVAWNE